MIKSNHKYYEFYIITMRRRASKKSATVRKKAQGRSFWHKEGVRTPDADQASQLRPVQNEAVIEAVQLVVPVGAGARSITAEEVVLSCK
jgi:hypothetical protein